MNTSINVRVTDDFSLDAGSLLNKGDYVTIVPPQQTMLDQLCTWLNARLPAGEVVVRQPQAWRSFIGATALCLRWGTWLAVLMDANKPLSPKADSHECSLISEGEMQRIQIEATHNLALLLKIYHQDAAYFHKLTRAAYEHLPMPVERVVANRGLIYLLKGLSMLPKLLPESEQMNLARQEVTTDPYRVLANALINTIYRNHPSVEFLHTGSSCVYTLTHRRITRRDEADIMQQVSSQLYNTLRKPPWMDAAWPNQLVGLRMMPFIYPDSWSFTESSSVFNLRREWIEES